VRCVYRVMHATWEGAGRAELCARLVSALPANRTRVIESPEPKGSWWTARRCWEDGVVADGATHVCVLNDDVEPIPGFDGHLHNALSAYPDQAIALYTKHKDCPQVSVASWYVSANGMTVGIVLPVSMALEMLAWVRDHFRLPAHAPKPYPSDATVDLFLMATGRRVYTTVPALVEHMAPDTSLLGNENHPGRKAAVTGTPGDWARPPVHLSPVFRGTHWHLGSHVLPSLFARAYEIEKEKGQR
jgi:hypothetical protein